MDFKKHSAIMSYFRQKYIKAGELEGSLSIRAYVSPLLG